MGRYIISLHFEGDKITITDNVESWTIDGKIEDFCPKVLYRWHGYIDRVKKVWKDEHETTT